LIKPFSITEVLKQHIFIVVYCDVLKRLIKTGLFQLWCRFHFFI